MKYMIMMFGDAASMAGTKSPEWIAEMMGFMNDLHAELTGAGELVVAEGLADSAAAKTVRFQNGQVAVTDGPFAESKESIIGFWVVDVASEERVLDIASRIVRYSEVAEVRPVGVAPE